VNTLELEPHLQRQVDAGSSGTDILHGHLKTQVDALTYIYQMTYALAFAIDERTKKNG